MKRVCLLIAGILFLLLFFSFSGIEKTKLLDTDGRNFEKAEVTKVISGNLSNSGSGKQTVELKLLSGDHKGKTIEATSSQSYLFGAKCKKGMKVIAIVNESNGEFVASVYSVNRGPMVWLMAAIFVAIVVAVGGRKGISSILSLVFTMLCIFFTCPKINANAPENTTPMTVPSIAATDFFVIPSTMHIVTIVVNATTSTAANIGDIPL